MPSPVREHGSEKINGCVIGERKRGRVRQVREVKRRTWWPTVVRNVVCASHRAEYVKSKDPVNASRGRKTSGVAGEAKLRETGGCAYAAIIFSNVSLS